MPAYNDDELVDGGKFVHHNESGPYGYMGVSQSRTPNAAYTVEGVTGATANTADTPPASAKKRVDDNTAAVKTGGAK